MSAIDTLLARKPPSTLAWTARVIMGLLFCFLLWASLAKLEEVAVATGEVVPQEQIQAIQHLEGGIIEHINVVEGDRVTRDQPLIQLNITPFVANREELQISLQSLHLKKARLEAESEGKMELVFDEAFKNYRAELIDSELKSFAGRRLKLENNLSQLREAATQKGLDKEQLQAEKESIASNLGVLQEKLRISADLIRDKLTPKIEHLQLKSEVQELQGRLNVVNVAIPRAEAAHKEAEERMRGEELNFRNQALDELRQVAQDIAKNEEMLTRATDQVQRTTIKSPIDGVVKSLKTHTIGGVVQPGDTIMEIVPDSKNLIVEARLNPNDIGFVKKGQKALVKVMTYDYARYGGLEGEVIFVSADSHTDRSSGDSYFLVKVQTVESALGEHDSLPITAGMQATADIHTGSKSVMEYLLKPVIKVSEESFRER